MDYCDLLLASLNEFRQEGIYCDVSIQVEGRTFTCHRAVLASVSKFFDHMFRGDFRESSQNNVVNLGEIDAEYFETILKFVYSGRAPILNEDNIYELFRSCDFLLLEGLKTRCVEYILENMLHMSSSKLFQIFHLACAINDRSLMENLSKCFALRLKEFVREDLFLVMASDCLHLVLEKYRLLPVQHCNDNFLLDAVVRWVFHSAAKRQKFLQELIETIDFEKITANCVQFLLNEYEIDFPKSSQLKINETSENRILCWKTVILNAFSLNLKLADEINYLPISFKDPPSGISSSIHMYVNIPENEPYGTCESLYNVFSLQNTESCDQRNNSIKHGVSGSADRSSWVISSTFIKERELCNPLLAAVGKPNRIYCLDQKSFRAYSSLDLSSNEYIQLTSRQAVGRSPLFGCIWTTNDKNIYLYDRNCHVIDIYNCEMDKWSSIPEPEYYASSTSIVAQNDSLYLIKSRPDLCYPMTIGQMYDNRTSKWTSLSATATHDHSLSCVSNNQLYLYGNDTLKVYDLVANYWRNLQVESRWSSADTTELLRSINPSRMMVYQNKLWFFSRTAEYITYNLKTRRLKKSIAFDKSYFRGRRFFVADVINF